MAIQQHPIPQDISNYRFRLIGDMTIKQFASLGIFIILSIVIYGSPIPFFFRYPLSFIFLITGITMAFVPIQGRTLDVWIIAFIKSIYSPTQYVWKSTPDTTTQQPPIDQQSATPNTPVVPISTPMSASNDTDTTATIQTNPASQPEQPPVDPVVEINSETKNTNLEVNETSTPQPVEAHEVKIPESPPVVIEKSETTTKEPPTQTQEIENLSVVTPPPSSTTTISQQTNQETPSTPPSISLPIPFTPTTPNTIVGLSLTPDEHILDGVMVEIKKDNFTIRATRSNKLGQFLFARPLENGIYQILAEKDGYNFTPYAIELKGDIIRPLKIQAI